MIATFTALYDALRDVCAAAKRHRASLRKPPKAVGEYLDVLARQQLADTVRALREHEDLI